MKLLIAVDPSRIIYLNKFASELSKFGIVTKIINEFDIYDDSISTQKYLKWFQIPMFSNGFRGVHATHMEHFKNAQKQQVPLD